MNNLLRGAIIIALALCTALAQAELYSWIDKDGKKHYGDKVPAEYAKQAKVIESKKANTMQAPPSVNYYQTPRPVNNDQQYDQPEEPDATPNQDASCEEKTRAYEESVACYSDCSKQGKKINNVSACGHCTDVKKPSCE